MENVSKDEYTGVNDRYLPAFAEIVAAFPELQDSDGRVWIPTRFLRFLLSQLADALPFDEELYAAENPDVAAAHKAGQIVSLREHFTETGYFEQRPLPVRLIDAQWYLNEYPDAANAVAHGAINDVIQHFKLRGRTEGRVGSTSQREQQARWRTELEELFRACDGVWPLQKRS